jgi:DNA processing protein
MAVPGKIDSPLSRGANRLIKQGAKLVDCVDDIMESLGYIGDKIRGHVNQQADLLTAKAEMPLFDIAQLNLSPGEKSVYECLHSEPVHIEQIIEDSRLPAGSVNASIVSLRLKGMVKQLPGSMFVRK